MTEARPPRDAQRRRVYLAETPLPGRRLPTLDDCRGFLDAVVGSLWWQARFPDLGLGNVPLLRPGYGARHAFFRVDEDGPTITLPRRYRTSAIVLHELCHWGLAADEDLPNHGRTFARLLLDATNEFSGVKRGEALAIAYAQHGVHVGHAPRVGPDGRLRYGWDERLHLGRGKVLDVHHHDDRHGPLCTRGCFSGWGRGRSTLRLEPDDGRRVVIPVASVWDVRRVTADANVDAAAVAPEPLPDALVSR